MLSNYLELRFWFPVPPISEGITASSPFLVVNLLVATSWLYRYQTKCHTYAISKGVISSTVYYYYYYSYYSLISPLTFHLVPGAK